MSQQNPNDPNRPFQPEHNVVGDSPLNPHHSSSQAYSGPPKKRHTVRNAILIGIGALVVFMIVIAALSPAPAKDATKNSAVPSASPVDNGPTPDPVVTPTNKPSSKQTTAKPTVQPSPKITHKPAPPMTASQEQAVGSAESYLSFTAFSRKGLIHQLSSDAGEGFSVKDATYAVDHITVNWNEQAAKSALTYLSMTHFSRKGLIHQLESSAGEQFTHAQAVYGVTKAGL